MDRREDGEMEVGGERNMRTSGDYKVVEATLGPSHGACAGGPYMFLILAPDAFCGVRPPSIPTKRLQASNLVQLI